MQLTKQHRWLVVVLAAWLALLGGCDDYGWLNIGIVIPLGLDGEVGLFNPFGEGSPFVPPQNNGDIEPPPPINVGDPSNPGGTGTLTS